VQTPNGDWDQVDWQQGYGFQFWMSRHGYRGDGAFGQFIVILPEHDTVIAMFSCTGDMQSVLDAMWEHLLPALGNDDTGDAHADAALAARMAGLTLPTAAERLGGTAPAGLAAAQFHRSDAEPSHLTVTGIETDGQQITIHEEDGSFTVPLTEPWNVDGSVATSATRLPDGRVAVDLSFIHTPHRLEVELDPATSTFVARWPLMPLFGVGADHRLAALGSLPD
jgi:hypothetical protein